MRILRYGLALIIATYFLLACMVASVPHHQIIFLNEACIKPYKSYDYHTCDDMRVDIDGDYYVVPKGFKTDLASVPRILWSIVAPQYTGFVAPAILHDYLYSCGNLGGRKWADEVLYNALLKEGVSKFTAARFYGAVRLFGGDHFEAHNKLCTRIVYGQINA